MECLGAGAGDSDVILVPIYLFLKWTRTVIDRLVGAVITKPRVIESGVQSSLVLIRLSNHFVLLTSGFLYPLM